VPRNVDGNNFLKAEIPFEFGANEGGHEATTSSVYVDHGIDVPGDQEIINCFGIFVFSRIGCPQDDTDADLDA
jgi:hypothetical protein